MKYMYILYLEVLRTVSMWGQQQYAACYEVGGAPRKQAPAEVLPRLCCRVRFDTPDRYLTPDHSVTMGMTLESISLARSKVGIVRIPYSVGIISVGC